MPSVHIDNVGEMAIIECAGRFVRSEAAFIMMRHRPLRLRPTVSVVQRAVLRGSSRCTVRMPDPWHRTTYTRDYPDLT
jgi:hypothetical protein